MRRDSATRSSAPWSACIEIWFTLGAIAAVVGAFTPRAQRLGDLLAGTYAERTRTPALPDQPAVLPPMLAEWAAVADVARLPDRLARRIAQFTRSAPQLEPAARERLAASLAAEAARYVSPVPAVPSRRRSSAGWSPSAATASCARSSWRPSASPRSPPTRTACRAASRAAERQYR